MLAVLLAPEAIPFSGKTGKANEAARLAAEGDKQEHVLEVWKRHKP